jgi:hypothetical protein
MGKDNYKNIPRMAEWVARHREQERQHEAQRAARIAASQPVRDEPIAISYEPVVLGVDTTTGEEVTLTHKERCNGVYIIGGTGYGKSTLIENLILQDIVRGIGVCVLDPHGDLIANVLARVPPEHERRVIVLDLTDEKYAFGLNIFDCPNRANPVALADARATVVQVFRKVWGEGEAASWGPRLEDLLRNIAHTMIENPGYTLLEVPRLLSDDTFRAHLVANVTSDTVREFWVNEYDSLNDREQRELRPSTLNKIRAFIGDPLLRHIVGQAKSSIDFRTVMNMRQVLLIKLSARQEDNIKLLGTTIVGRILFEALARESVPVDSRVPFSLYADEYDLFATRDFARLLKEARKYKVATHIAHQDRGLLSGAQKAATMQVDNHIIFRVIGNDAQELAWKFDHRPPEVAEPERVLVADPLEHLKRNSNKNPEVIALVATINALLLEEEAAQGERYRIFALRTRGIRDLDNLARPSGYEMANSPHAADLAWSSQYHLVTGEEYAAGQLGDPPEVYTRRLKQLIQDHLVMFMRCESEEDYDWNLDEKLRSYMYDQVRSVILPDRTSLYTVAENVARLGSQGKLFKAVSDLGRLLCQDKLLVRDDQQVSVERQRTYSDMRDQVANNLSTLIEYHARCRLGKHDHTMRTLPPQPLEEAASSAAVRAASQRLYCRLRTDVEKEIAVRQRGLPQLPSSEEKKSLISPRAILSPPAYGKDNILPQRPDDDDEEGYLTERKR